jgi:hypothetical protein
MTRVAWIAVGGVTTVAVALAVALAVSLAGGDDDPEAPGAPAGVVTPGAVPSEEFQDCLSEQGVEPPEPGTPQRAPDEGFQDALEACADLLPEGAQEGGGLRIMPPPSG